MPKKCLIYWYINTYPALARILRVCTSNIEDYQVEHKIQREEFTTLHQICKALKTYAIIDS